MDVGAFVQENKRWLVGCTVGFVIWLIAGAVIGSIYDVRGVASSPQKLGAPTTPMYDQAALTTAREQNDALVAERERLQRDLAFVPAAKYRQWDGPADQYLYVAGRDLVQVVADAASLRSVQFREDCVQWEVLTGIDEIRAELIGLDLIDEIQQRLFSAHDAVRATDAEANGLFAIQSLKLEPQRLQRQARRAPRSGEVDLRDLLEQQVVSLQFQSDEATLAAFLESCRRPGRTLVVDSWALSRPQRPGEPCTVKAQLACIVFKEGA